MLSFREREFFRRNNGGKAKFRKRQVLNSNPTPVVYYRLLGKSNTREKNFLLGYLFLSSSFLFFFFFSFFFITLDKTSYFLLLRCVVPKVALALWRSTRISSFYKTFKTLNSKFYYESKVDMILVENDSIILFFGNIFRENERLIKMRKKRVRKII